MKLNLACGNDLLKDFTNLDIKDNWYFQNGLGQFQDNSIEAITISHSLMFLTEKELEIFFKECFRVLQKNGVIRITEDWATYWGSKVFGGWWSAKLLTSPILMEYYLKKSGFQAFRVAEDETKFKDKSLIRILHGHHPRVFFIEGLK